MTLPDAAWVRVSWREGFFWRRVTVSLLLSLGPAALCFAAGFGLLGLGLFAIGAWPWPVRISVAGDGALQLRWLFLRECWPAASIVRMSVQPDARRWALARRPVLAIERRARGVTYVFGASAR